MTKATFLGETIAESDKTVEVDGCTYFPRDKVDFSFLSESETRTSCHHKGEARYYDVTVHGQTIKDGAFTYEHITRPYKRVEGWIAFWKGVIIE